MAVIHGVDYTDLFSTNTATAWWNKLETNKQTQIQANITLMTSYLGDQRHQFLQKLNLEFKKTQNIYEFGALINKTVRSFSSTSSKICYAIAERLFLIVLSLGPAAVISTIGLAIFSPASLTSVASSLTSFLAPIFAAMPVIVAGLLIAAAGVIALGALAFFAKFCFEKLGSALESETAKQIESGFKASDLKSNLESIMNEKADPTSHHSLTKVSQEQPLLELTRTASSSSTVREEKTNENPLKPDGDPQPTRP